MTSRLRTYGPPLLLISPSLLLVGVFVYLLIGQNLWTSLTDNHTAGQANGRRPIEFTGLENYTRLLGTEQFRHSLLNLVLFTGAFLIGALAIGFVWAWLLERPLRGGRIFQTVYLFPMAISFVASGVVWRWLLNSNQGEMASGLNRLFQMVGLGFLQNPWWNNITFGILAIALPAIWQLAGYVMALFLAGFRGVPEDLREAARVDGASEFQVYRHVIFPQLTPVVMSAIVIIAHMSLKSFDLIMSISKPSNYQTKVPAVDMFVFKSSFDYADAAAVGTFLLAFIAVLIVPYLINQHRERTR